MRLLSKKTKYALNALVYLADNNSTDIVSIATISRSENIPLKFLSQILQTLSIAGIVRSKRGKAGGFSLEKTPADIRLLEIIELFEGPLEYFQCIRKNNATICDECRNYKVCGMNFIFNQVSTNSENLLNSFTIFDIMAKNQAHHFEAKKSLN